MRKGTAISGPPLRPSAKRGRSLPIKRDDGQDITGLTFTPDAAALLYVRGAHRIAAVRSRIPRRTPAARSKHLGNCSGRGVNPSVLAKAMARWRRRTVCTSQEMAGLTVTLAADVKPEPLMKVRGQVSQLTPSPDGSTLAFVSGRGDHSFIGLYDIGAKSVRWLSSSVDLGTAPAFSPDSKALRLCAYPRRVTGTSSAPSAKLSVVDPCHRFSLRHSRPPTPQWRRVSLRTVRSWGLCLCPRRSVRGSSGPSSRGNNRSLGSASVNRRRRAEGRCGSCGRRRKPSRDGSIQERSHSHREHC